MATVAPPPPDELVLPGAGSVPAATRRSRERRREARVAATTRLLRLVAFAALAAFGTLHWARQLAPTASGVAVQTTVVAIGLAVVLLALGRRPPGRPRAVLGWGAGVLAALVMLPASGIPVELLLKRNWGELTDGLGAGLTALPNLNVPYRGLDEWVRWVVTLGGGLLALLAAALAFAPGRADRVAILPASLVLGLLYGVSVVERNPESPFLSGAGFALALALFLGAERMAAGARRARAITAGGALAAVALGLLVAPQLDGADPWLDYRSFAQDIAERNQARYSWDHSYSPLDWPRDGREVLRIKSDDPAYWKATTLQRFDGARWLRDAPPRSDVLDVPPSRRGDPDLLSFEVTVRSLRSEEYLTAGFAYDIRDVPRPAIPAGSGTFRAARPLKPGDTYTASVYNPRPDGDALSAAGVDYPRYLLPYLTMELPEAAGGPAGREATTIVFPFFGTPARTLTAVPPEGQALFVDDEVMRDSGYARTWDLAQRLRASSATPYEYLRAVRRRVQQGARYTEDPAQAPLPLDAFLHDTREGYCQQFSGAMALLLRMGGVPARVASGFSPGSFDDERDEYVVRDLDAHSWVEAYFPELGWVTFDPTPTVAPPRAQDAGDGGETLPDEDEESGASGQGAGNAGDAAAEDKVPEPGAGAGTGGGGVATPVLVGGGLVLLLAGAGAWWWIRPRSPVPPLVELRRALARSGRPVREDTTLHALEQTFSDAPAARDYVRKLRLARYAGAQELPTVAERAALRRELAAGLGLRGRARAWWALPPRPRGA